MKSSSSSYPLFDIFLLVRLRESDNGDLKPYVRYMYKNNEKNSEKNNNITITNTHNDILQFCYPDINSLKKTKSQYGENFTFILSESSGSRVFGFCRRHLPAASIAKNIEDYYECIVLLSHYPFYALFNSIMEYVQIRWLLVPGAVFPLLNAILEHPFPLPGEAFTVRISGTSEERNNEESFTFERNEEAPPPNMDLLFRLLTVEDIVTLITCLLLEKRVIITAKKLSTLSACIHAASSLLYPFVWQHIFIPLIPSNLLSFCCAPMPYFIGVNTQQLDSVLSLPLDETLLVNLDEGTLGLINCSTKLLKLPNFALSPLISSLESCVKNKNKSLGNIDTNAISTAFLTMFSELFGNWRKYVRSSGKKNGRYKIELDTWVEDTYELGKTYTEFLLAIRQSQLFEVFCREQCMELEQSRAGKFARLTYDKMPSNALLIGIVNFLNEKNDVSEESEYRDFMMKLTSNDTELIEAKSNKQSALATLTSFGRDLGILDPALNPEQLQAELKRGMRMIIHGTFSTRFFSTIMSVIWLRLEDSAGKQWRHAFKALQLSKKLIELGSDRVICHFRDRIDIIQSFVEYQHEDAHIRDSVSEQASIVLNMVSDLPTLSANRRILYPKIVQIKKYFFNEPEPGTIPAEIPKENINSENHIPTVFDLTAYMEKRKKILDLPLPCYKEPTYICNGERGSFKFRDLHKLTSSSKSFLNNKPPVVRKNTIEFEKDSPSHISNKPSWDFPSTQPKFSDSGFHWIDSTPVKPSSQYNDSSWDHVFNQSTSSSKPINNQSRDPMDLYTKSSKPADLFPIEVQTPPKYAPKFSIQQSTLLTQSPPYVNNMNYSYNYQTNYSQYQNPTNSLTAYAAPTAKALALSGRSTNVDPYANIINEIKGFK